MADDFFLQPFSNFCVYCGVCAVVYEIWTRVLTPQHENSTFWCKNTALRTAFKWQARADRVLFRPLDLLSSHCRVLTMWLTNDRGSHSTRSDTGSITQWPHLWLHICSKTCITHHTSILLSTKKHVRNNTGNARPRPKTAMEDTNSEHDYVNPILIIFNNIYVIKHASHWLCIMITYTTLNT